MQRLELYRIGEPAHGIADRADRELDQDLLALAVVVVGEDFLVVRPNLDLAVQEIALGAVDPAAAQRGLEQYIAGIGVRQPDSPLAALGQQYTAAIIIVEADAQRPSLRRRLRRRRIGPLLRRSRA